jgi:hypothetical protein
MNRIGKKEIASDAAKLFEQELRRLRPDIPREELCGMVDEYIYYQTDDLTRTEARTLVDGTCRMPRQRRRHR